MKNIIFVLIVCCNCQLLAQSENGGTEITSKVIFASIATNLNDFDRTVRVFSNDREQLVEELQKTLLNSKASNLKQCEAAFYLGELRIPAATETLSAKITLRFDATHLIITHLPSFKVTPAVEALVKIGTPCIPAVLRNLAESDDAKVRELSLEVIERIDGDKDISTLRLQKAIKAETDAQKQTRLQAALKALVSS